MSAEATLVALAPDPDCSMNPLDCIGDVIGDKVGDLAASGWEAVARSTAEGTVKMLEFFAKGFAGFPTVDFGDAGVRSVYTMCLGIAAVVAVLIMLVQAGRSAITGSGDAIATAFVGLGKALLAFLVTLTMAGVAVVVADGITDGIIQAGFGGNDGLRDKLTSLFKVQPGLSGTLLFILALLGMVLVIALWFELLLRNVALTLLVAASPIAAVGQMSDTTKGWWAKTVSAAIQLIILKPVIALCFVIGFKLTGNAQGLNGLMTGLVCLLFAVIAWWLIARFLPFTTVTAGSGGGLGGLLGFGANAANGGRSGPAHGVDPEDFSKAAEARTVAAHTSRAGAAANGAGGAAAGEAGAAAGAGAATGGVTIAAFAVKAGLDAAQKAANSLAGKSEQMAGHAGLDGNPHAHPAGYPRHAPPAWPGRAGPSPEPVHDGGATSEQEPPPAPPADLPPPRAEQPNPIQVEKGWDE